MQKEHGFSRTALWTVLVWLIGLTPYLLYLIWMLRFQQGPVDFETFLSFGRRVLASEVIYDGTNYYPMPFVYLFALLAALPRPLSVLLWFVTPVLTALWITGWNPRVLFFAPLLSHFLGGQSSLPGLVGLWLYRQHASPNAKLGGIGLGVLSLKPQLGILPWIYATVQWFRFYRQNGHLPKQAWSFLQTVGVLYGPTLVTNPVWPLEWLHSPRPLFARALAGLVPRLLIHFVPATSLFYWGLWAFMSGLLFTVLGLSKKRAWNLDHFLLWGFLVHPLVHDYDLIQLIPLLTTRKRWLVALIASIPGWYVVLFKYTQDAFWMVFAWIAPALLVAALRERAPSVQTPNRHAG